MSPHSIENAERFVEFSFGGGTSEKVSAATRGVSLTR
jgi:hypothetical protein